jgi:hypothetical protein
MVNGGRISFTNPSHIVLVEDDAAQRLRVTAYLIDLTSLAALLSLQLGVVYVVHIAST